MKERLKQNKLVFNTYRRTRRSFLITKTAVLQQALDVGLLPNHDNYTRFVIISRGRSGTSFLRSMLNDHPQVTTFGEIFRTYGEIGWDRPDYRATKAQLNLIQTDPVSFLEKALFRTYPKETMAVGFKLFYYHAQNSEWKPVWQYLQDSPEIRVIHLRRENVLATHLSLRRAFMTNKWNSKSDKSEDSPMITLTYEDCLEAFEATKQFEHDTDAFFAGHKYKLDMTYETLSSDTQAEMKRVQTFLGLEYFPTRTRLRKQNKKSLAESIANYEELRHRFVGTEFQRYFED